MDDENDIYSLQNPGIDDDFLLDDVNPADFQTDRGIQLQIDDSIAKATTPGELHQADIDIDQISGKVSASYIKTKVRKQIVKVLKQNDALSRMLDPSVLKSPELASHKKDVDLIDEITPLDFNQQDFEEQLYSRIDKYAGTMSQKAADQLTSALTGGTAEQQIKAAKIIDGIDQRFNYASKRLTDSLRNRANLINIVSAAGTPPLETIEKVNEMDRPLTKAMKEGLSDSIRDQKLLDRDSVRTAVEDALGLKKNIVGGDHIGVSAEAAAEYDKAYRAFYRGNAEAAAAMAKKVIKNRFSHSALLDPDSAVSKATPEAYVNQFLPKLPVADVREHLKSDINEQLQGISSTLKAAGVGKPSFLSSLFGKKTEGDYVGNKDVVLAPIPGASQTSGKFLVTTKDPDSGLYRPLYAQNNERVIYTVDPKVVQQKALEKQQAEIDAINKVNQKKREAFLEKAKTPPSHDALAALALSKPKQETPKDRGGSVKTTKDLQNSTAVPDTGAENQTFGFSAGGI